MKFYLFLIVCLVHATAYSQVPVEEYYENGVLKSIGRYNNNKREGLWKFYEKEGHLITSGSYTNGKMNGIWNNYYNNGTVSGSGNFINGLKEGEWKFYYENGTLKETGNFKNDLRDGVWKTFDNTGKLSTSGKYEKDIHEGEWKSYYANGQVYEIVKYADGFLNGDFKSYYENGTLLTAGKYTNDSKIGPWTYYHPNGQVSIKENYEKSTYNPYGTNNNEYQNVKDNKTGEWNSYYENGQLYITGYYDKNKKTGPWQYYGEKGNLILKGSYKNDARIGEWVAYYNNGNPLLKGKYLQDIIRTEFLGDQVHLKSVGTWISYWEDGSEAKHYDFDDSDSYIEKVISTKFNDKYIYPNGDGGYGKGQTVMSLGISLNDAGKAVLDFEQALKNFGSFYRYGKWEEYTKEGWKFAEGNYNWQTNKSDGLWTYYNSKGNITATKVYKDGKLNGITTYFRENGQKSSEVTMANDYITATTAWDENGKLSEKSTGDGKGKVNRVYYYPNGNMKSFGSETWNNKEKKYERFGNWTYNFENGVKELVEIYKDGTLSKRWEQYLKSGEKILSDGNGEYRTFHKNGQVSYAAQIKNGVEDGIATWYHDNGTKELVFIYKNGTLTKTWEQYLRSGEKILSDGNGEFKTFHANGQVSFAVPTNNGARDGIATWYYDNGQIEQAVLYQYDEKSTPIGKRIEIVSSFHKDGRARDKGTLKNGNGTWISYNEKGEVSAVDTYKNGYKVK